MFCTKCGKELPEGVTACEACDTVEATATAAPASPNLPVDENGAPHKKLAFFYKHGSKKVKTLNYVTLGLGLFFILLVIISTSTFLNRSIFESRFAKLSGTIIGQDIGKIQDEYDDMADDINEALEEGDSLKSVENKYGIDFDYMEDEFDITPEEFAKLVSPLSLKSLAKISAISNVSGMGKVASDVLNGFIKFIRGLAIIIVILLALSAAFKKTWLCVMGFVPSVILLAITGGFIFVALAIATFVVSLVFLSKIKAEYRAYKNALTPNT